MGPNMPRVKMPSQFCLAFTLHSIRFELLICSGRTATSFSILWKARLLPNSRTFNTPVVFSMVKFPSSSLNILPNFLSLNQITYGTFRDIKEPTRLIERVVVSIAIEKLCLWYQYAKLMFFCKNGEGGVDFLIVWRRFNLKVNRFRAEMGAPGGWAGRELE